MLTGEYCLEDHGVDARIIHTPGHTPGSVSVLLDQGDLIAATVRRWLDRELARRPYRHAASA